MLTLNDSNNVLFLFLNLFYYYRLYHNDKSKIQYRDIIFLY